MTPAVVAVVLLLQGGAGEPRRRDAWFSADKVKHFFASAFVQSVAYSSVRAAGASHGGSLAAASATTGALGVAKEARDRRAYGTFSFRDLAWDAAGAGLATLMLRRTAR